MAIAVFLYWLGDLRKRDYFEDLDVNDRIILKWIFEKRVL